MPSLFGDRDPLKDLPGLQKAAKATLYKKTPPDAQGFQAAIKYGPASTRRRFKWNSLYAADVHRVFLVPKMDQIAGELALGMGRLFLAPKRTTTWSTSVQITASIPPRTV